MKDETRQKLLELNRIFYEKNAKEFSNTRNYYWQGWQKAWEVIKTHNPNIRNVLDVGCGNGRFLKFLRENTENFTYLGIDHSSNFIEECQNKLADENSYFMRFEIANDDFTKIANEKYDLISLIAVLHHIPGNSNRIDLIKQLSKLLKPKGIIIITFWDFMKGNRMQSRIFPWSLSNIDKKDLEEGDHLLKWSDSTDTQRYCHYFSEEEKQSLIKYSQLRPLSRYTSDSNNTYVIMQKE
ncbi:MAG TPA: class I SAM-dependent methyltransferase [Candidatus Dojkabacteria bacterium]|nr:class I SAM-dependent methyltransferase [Candidatus Dojkabacteria bacterium]HRO65083.1 class I SAM-dependent methyltransferase [Candidatus Dojkabacteria bacterium]HRP36644.1 class I SAM-dependent methyltransferase [Candidatus Dojkabacteria bacterium]HRP50915.1 class I SAM-dependent methyltransferase [Candidatus Dojkabacteria bacterium]